MYLKTLEVLIKPAKLTIDLSDYQQTCANILKYTSFDDLLEDFKQLVLDAENNRKHLNSTLLRLR